MKSYKLFSEHLYFRLHDFNLMYGLELVVLFY